MSPPADPALYTGPILVTALYLGLWYSLLFGLQSRTKYRLKAEYAARGQEFDRYFGQDPQMLAADRAVINTQEQMVPFLVSMWLHAVFVSPDQAAVLGLVYTLLRAAYPFLLGGSVSKAQSKRVFLATGPSYAIVFFLLGRSVFEAVTAG